MRDFSYLRALKNKNFILARDILRDLEKTLAIANENARNQGDLILVSTAETMMVDFPDQGEAGMILKRMVQKHQLNVRR